MYEFFYNLGLKAAEVVVPGGMASIGSGRMGGGGSTMPRTQTGFNSSMVGGSFWNNQQQTSMPRQFSAAGPSGSPPVRPPMALPAQQPSAAPATPAAPAAPAAPVAAPAPKAPAAPAAPAAASAAAPTRPPTNSAADLAKVAPKGTMWTSGTGMNVTLPAGQVPPDQFFAGPKPSARQIAPTTARVGVDPNSRDMSPAFANAYAARALAQDPRAFSQQLASGAIPGRSGLRAMTDRDYPDRPVGRRAIDQI